MYDSCVFFYFILFGINDIGNPICLGFRSHKWFLICSGSSYKNLQYSRIDPYNEIDFMTSANDYLSQVGPNKVIPDWLNVIPRDTSLLTNTQQLVHL